jgi:hypothetical protein
LVEHATENRSVGGSIPPLGTTFHNKIRGLRLKSFPGRSGNLDGDVPGTQILRLGVDPNYFEFSRISDDFFAL